MNILHRRRWINWALLALVVSLVALARLDQGKPSSIMALPGVSATQIQRIEVSYPQRESLIFERQGAVWQMTAPGHGPANPVLINRVLDITELRCPLHYAAAALDLSALHLQPPQLRLMLGGQDIHFGTITATEGLRYLRVGTRVYLCPDRFYALLASAAASFLAPGFDSRTPR